MSVRPEQHCHSEPARTLVWESPSNFRQFFVIQMVLFCCFPDFIHEKWCFYPGDCHTSDIGHWFAMTGSSIPHPSARQIPNLQGRRGGASRSKREKLPKGLGEAVNRLLCKGTGNPSPTKRIDTEFSDKFQFVAPQNDTERVRLGAITDHARHDLAARPAGKFQFAALLR